MEQLPRDADPGEEQSEELTHHRGTECTEESKKRERAKSGEKF
jgi:hypothetical protein